jgi:glutamate-5-semialdehyde dehydrogenase
MANREETYMTDLLAMGKVAKASARVLAITPASQKNVALTAVVEALEANKAHILDANSQDVMDARKDGLSEALVDRLTLNPVRLAGILADVRKVTELDDPVGEEFDQTVRKDGLKIRKRRTPIGVLGVIYESRPNVTVDVAALALKSGNAAIMRGGKETARSNQALIEAIAQGIRAAGLPAQSIQSITDPDRNLLLGLLKLYQHIDMIIPRGGAGLHRFCRENSTIPVITGGIGVCHLFVDSSADLDKSLEVILNAKTQRPSVCNALDTLLVHEEIAAAFLPRLVEHLSQSGVSFRADEIAMKSLKGWNEVTPADPDDWDQEWLSLVLGLKVVGGLEEAIDHITEHSTGHSDGILTKEQQNANIFVDQVDSAAVFVNASTRFNDGAELGLGAEVAVSTQKLHARGPMALKELTTYKWVVVGEMHSRV